MVVQQFLTDSLAVLRSPRVATFERHRRDDARTAILAVVVGLLIVTGLQVVSSVVQGPARVAQRETIEQQLGGGPMGELLRVLESPAAVVALGMVSIPLTVGVWMGLPYLLSRALGGSGTFGAVAYAAALGLVPLSVLDALLSLALSTTLGTVFLCLSLSLDAARVYLLYAGVRAVMGLEGWRAALAALLPLIAMLIVSCAAAIIAGVAVALTRTAP